MAIISPSEMPQVLKLRSESIKSYVLSQLGHGTVEVELSEPQLEQAIRVAGDFIAGYFPREQRLAVFNTQPLRNTYPMPNDAYWIQEVVWDPVTTRISDIFGAESFLFCFPGGIKLLTTKGPKTCEEIYNDKKARLVTPFGNRKPKMKWNDNKQQVELIVTEKDALASTINHPIYLNNKFRMMIESEPGFKLLNSDDKQPVIIDRHWTNTNGTWSISTSCGCFYASANGNEFYLVH